MDRETPLKEKEIWDEHWENLNESNSLFGRFCKLYRIRIISDAVRYYLDKYFARKGIFIEAGSGTSQTSIRIKKRGRKLIAVDFSKIALDEARKIRVLDDFVIADIKKLPFENNSIDGIWNLGVMEHFEYPEIKEILTEFKRALKPGGAIILFWPGDRAPYRKFLNTLEWLKNLGKGKKKKFQFFPDEVSRLKSKKQGYKIIKANGFKKCKIFFNWRDLWTHYVIVCKK